MEAANAISIPQRIERAFAAVTQKTGASFEFLVNTAFRESRFDPTAQAQTSSATGLFQFVESTWLEALKLDGARFGYHDVARDIEQSDSGGYTVRDSKRRAEILALRNDPMAATAMASAYAERNAHYLEKRLGRSVSDGELYVAHFLGPNGGARLIELAANKPNASAAKVFPRPAAANKSIFYEKSGAERSVQDVYQRLVKTHDSVATQIASSEPAEPTVVETTAETPDQAVALAFASWDARQTSSPFAALFRAEPEAQFYRADSDNELFNRTKAAQAHPEKDDGSGQSADRPGAIKTSPVSPLAGPLDLTAYLVIDAAKRG